jgi:hypothetical protein
MNKDIVKMKLFMNTLDNLVDFLMNTFPMFEADIQIAKQGIRVTRMANPKMVVQEFMEYIGPYAMQIHECDESFFLDKHNLKNAKIKDIDMGFAEQLRDIWSSDTIQDAEKAQIWFYFQKLLKYGNDVL